MKWNLAVILMLLPALFCRGQEHLSEILFLTGETDAESLDGQILERFDALSRRPVMINMAGRGELASSGLFTPFQVASVLDYRSREGDILSFAELAFVDGFGESVAAALKPFVSLYSDRMPGQRPDSLVKQTSMARCGVSGNGWNAGGKYRLSSRRFEGAAALGRPASGTLAGGAYVCWKGRKWLGKVVAGDFNARFGQGLALWSGFSLSGLSTPESFARRPSGLSPSWSWSGTAMRGAGADFNLGRFCLTLCADIPFLKGDRLSSPIPMANLVWYSRFGQAGLTASGRVVSIDGRFCLKGVDLYGEAAFDWRNRLPAGVVGTTFPAGDFLLSILGRWYPAGFSSLGGGAVRSGTRVSDEAGAAVGAKWKGYSIVFDASLKPSSDKRALKAVFVAEQPLTEVFTLKFRATERLRNYSPANRTDLRADLAAVLGRWQTNIRANAVFSSAYGLLGYAEQGFRTERASAWLRVTLFLADRWDDRIYSYERDAPGNFNVPAYCGRGFSLSLTGSCKLLRGKLKLYARAAFTRNYAKDSRKGEAKLQAVWDF